MGLKKDLGIIDIMKEGLKKSYNGKSVLMLGKQDMYITIDELFQIAKKLQYELSDVDSVEIDKNGMINSTSFFKLLGFEIVESMDVSCYENASIIYDLNKDELPENLVNKFDYIIDGGTFEHLFNIQNAFKNVIKMLKIRGKIFHYVTTNNYIDHGFYSFSPTLFIEYYYANNFFIEDTSLIYEDDNSNNSLTTKIDCRLIDFIHGYNCMIEPSKPTIFQCIAQKREDSTDDNIPIQKKFFEQKEMFTLAKQRVDEIFNIYDHIAFYGTGSMVCKLIEYLERRNDGSIDKIIGLVDRNNVGKFINGILVNDLNEIIEKKVKVICIASSLCEQEIYYRIKKVEQQGVKIVKLLS